MTIVKLHHNVSINFVIYSTESKTGNVNVRSDDTPI